VNRSKRSITLDLKDEEDVAKLRGLLADADVLVENFRPGVMDRLGLGAEALEALNDRLIVLSITGFGEGGPDGHRSGFDQIIQGEAGLMSVTGPVGGPPTKMGIPITDILAGMFGAQGVVAALYDRERSGKGQRVTTSLLAAAVAVHAFQGTRWTIGGEVPEPGGNRHPTISPYGAYTCADGYVNVAVGSEGLWRRFAPAIGLDPDDPRYATNALRVEHVEELTAEIDAALVAEPVETWMARFDEAGVPAGRIATMDQVYASPQLAHLDLVDHVSTRPSGRSSCRARRCAGRGRGAVPPSRHPPSASTPTRSSATPDGPWWTVTRKCQRVGGRVGRRDGSWWTVTRKCRGAGRRVGSSLTVPGER
jgi:crotonobetainyl-CoA:carnitine CoA-transferase CaiB-like acyl-CoA transferase